MLAREDCKGANALTWTNEVKRTKAAADRSMVEKLGLADYCYLLRRMVCTRFSGLVEVARRTSADSRRHEESERGMTNDI